MPSFDDDDRCSPRRCFLACLGCGCFCLALPTVAGLFSGGTSVGAAEHLQEVRSIVLSGYAPALISGYLQKPDANVDAFSACMEDCGKSDRCKDSCTLSLKLKARKRASRKKGANASAGRAAPPHVHHAHGHHAHHNATRGAKPPT
jgi:hypothetical protein